MRATELDRAIGKNAPGFVRTHGFEAVQALDAVSSCPFRVSCGSPRCDGDWTKPDCPGSNKGA